MLIIPPKYLPPSPALLPSVVVVQSLSHVWTLWGPSDCSTPALPVLHCLPEFAQTHVHWVSDAIQPSHPLPPASPAALNLSQHQGLFQWVGSSHQQAKILVLQHQSLLEASPLSWYNNLWAGLFISGLTFSYPFSSLKPEWFFWNPHLTTGHRCLKTLC